MMYWNVTLDENKHGIMTPSYVIYETDILYFNPDIIDLHYDMIHEDDRIRELEEEWMNESSSDEDY